MILLHSQGALHDQCEQLQHQADVYRELIDCDQIIGQSLIHVVKEYRRVLAQMQRLSDEMIKTAHAPSVRDAL